MAHTFKILDGVSKAEDLLEVRDMITENLSHWENNLRHQGFEKGAKKGFEKGESSLLCQLIEHRFGPLPDWARVKLDEADTQTLERWGLQLLEAEKLEDVFG